MLIGHYFLSLQSEFSSLLHISFAISFDGIIKPYLTQAQMTMTSTVFDGKYYQEVVKKTGNKGFFQSDRALYNTSAGWLLVRAVLIYRISALGQCFSFLCAL
jgi:hypothetical protein